MVEVANEGRQDGKEDAKGELRSGKGGKENEGKKEGKGREGKGWWRLWQ